MAQAHRVGSVFAVGGVDLWRGWTWLQRGELAEAEDSVRRALEATMLVGDRHGAGMAYVSAFLSRTLLERGDLAGARAALATRGDPSPGSDGDPLVRRGEIELLLAEGQWTQALAEAEDYQAALQGVDNPAWGPWRSLTAIALDALGEHEPAFALLEQELVDARRWGAPGALSRTLRLLGTMRGDDGLEQLQEAAAVAEGSSARLELAKALTALGSALRRRRRPTAARDPLRRGLELARRCGAQSLADHARAELYAAGGRPRRAALAGPASLTPSERRIAELAAGGRSNREIAQVLYVTPKTVEIHLTSVYRKLGISRRAALSGALTERSVAGRGWRRPRRSWRSRGPAGRAGSQSLGVLFGGFPDARSGLEAETAWVTARVLQLTVDLRVDGDEISGHAGDGSGRTRPFFGWLGLIGAIDELVAGPSPRGARRAAPEPWKDESDGERGTL